MYSNNKIGALLLIGGEGRRFGSPTPKQFHLLGGKPVYTHAFETLLKTNLFDEILLVCHRDWKNEVNGAKVVEGGATRQESSYLGIKGFSSLPDIILIHDGVRPFVTEKILVENIEGAFLHGAIDTCIPSADTLVHAPDGKIISSIPKRQEYLRGQTPQTFRADWILEAHEWARKQGIENATDDCQLLLQMGRPITIVKGCETNLKITSEFDLLFAENLLTKNFLNLAPY